jgi:hypothetical protein
MAVSMIRPHAIETVDNIQVAPFAGDRAWELLRSADHLSKVFSAS